MTGSRDRAGPASGVGEAPEADEPFLRRWSRLKSRGGEQSAAPVPLPEEQLVAGPGPEYGPDDATEEALQPGDEDMPPLESLGEDSDYSAFMSPRVSVALRKQALRKLFRSPRFNVISQLDDYIDDYRNYPALGDIVTADMKHAAERLLKQGLDALVEGTEEGAEKGGAAAAATSAQDDRDCAPAAEDEDVLAAQAEGDDERRDA